MTPTPEQIALRRIKDWTLKQDDTVWFDEITTLHDLCDQALTAAAGVGPPNNASEDWAKAQAAYAAAGVGDRRDEHIAYLEGQLLGKREATIDRCAQWLGDNYDHAIVHSAAHAMRRALKDKP